MVFFNYHGTWCTFVILCINSVSKIYLKMCIQLSDKKRNKKVTNDTFRFVN